MTQVDGWLRKMESAGRELIEPVSALDSLDAIEARGTRPSIGWWQRYSRPVNE